MMRLNLTKEWKYSENIMPEDRKLDSIQMQSIVSNISISKKILLRNSENDRNINTIKITIFI